MLDRRIKKEIPANTPMGIKVILYCPDCGAEIKSRFSKTCEKCGSKVIKAN